MRKIKDKSRDYITGLNPDEVKLVKRNLITKLVIHYFSAFANLMAVISLITAIKAGATYFILIIALVNFYFVVFNLSEIIIFTSILKKINRQLSVIKSCEK